MATWTGLDHTPQIVNSAEEWRNKCLLADESLFADENLWALENFVELKDLFVGNPIVGNRTFYDKLREQIGNAKPPIIQLASEALWLLLLFVYQGSMKPATKRQRILEVWGISGASPPTSPHLDDDVLRGLANPGTAFMAGIWAEYGFLLTLMEAWKGLSTKQQSSLLSDKPWELGDWISGANGSDVRSFRHMFLYLCYPNHYEKICSRTAKKQIYAAFSKWVSEGKDPYKGTPSPCTLDQSIYQVREALQEEHGTEELDFYFEPYRDLVWGETTSEDQRRQKVDSSAARSDHSRQRNSTLKLRSKRTISRPRRSGGTSCLFGEERRTSSFKDLLGVGKTFAARNLGVRAHGQLKRRSVSSSSSFTSPTRTRTSFRAIGRWKDGFQLKNGSFYEFCRVARSNPGIGVRFHSRRN